MDTYGFMTAVSKRGMSIRRILSILNLHPMSAIQLTSEETLLYASIKENVKKLREGFEEEVEKEEMLTWLQEASEKAHQLHLRLKERGKEPKHHNYMINNRGCASDSKEFYENFHPLEDLLKFIEDEHANDDPEDVTQNETFEFTVFSNRWEHEDKYKLTRTSTGWECRHISINGPCDKGGKPYLIENLRHDYIAFPDGLESRMEWVWDRAANGALKSEIQASLNELSSWVILIEKNAPRSDFWKGF